MKKKLALLTIIFILLSVINTINVNSEGSGVEESLDSIKITFAEHLNIPTEYHDPVVKLVNENRSGLKTSEREFMATFYVRQDEESYITLVPLYVVEAGWNIELKDEDIIELTVTENEDAPTVSIIENLSSSSQLGYTPPPGDYMPDYLFPWVKDKSWEVTQGWHQGGNNIDFAPKSGSAAILAAGSGRVTGVCSDPYQVRIQVSHPDPDTDWTRYLHIAASTYDTDLTNKHIPEGQYLGDAFNGTVTDNPSCPTPPSYQYNTFCGCGNGQHMHFTVSRTDMKIQGDTANTIANSVGTEYTSKNRRIGICGNPPGSGSWTISESCSILSNTIFNNNVVVSSNSILAIPDTITLNLSLGSYSLNISSGSGLLVKNGGKID